tara:strand:- start:314 stop:562 length:249 start_codon:yes stop_codon:yes gene_type:complete
MNKKRTPSDDMVLVSPGQCGMLTMNRCLVQFVLAANLVVLQSISCAENWIQIQGFFGRPQKQISPSSGAAITQQQPSTEEYY